MTDKSGAIPGSGSSATATCAWWEEERLPRERSASLNPNSVLRASRRLAESVA
jgi:hypothetical protein